jgi:hypothetical protein
MKRIPLAGLFLIAGGMADVAWAADAAAVGGAGDACKRLVDPYTNYACLEPWLGTGFAERLYNYYRLEWGRAAAPVDPKAPPASRPEWPPTPQSTPPMPFSEWPYGGTAR